MPSPQSGSGLLTVGKPLDGPNSEPPADEAPSEEPMEEIESPVERLLGNFYNEIDMADYVRQPKEWKWMKIDKYHQGKDVVEPPSGYTESTFFYRRLPRITQIAKAKIFKHISPIQGHPWDVKASPRHDEGETNQKVSSSESKVKLEIEDAHEAMDLESHLDDTSLFMSTYGTAVWYGPINLRRHESQKNKRNDGRRPSWICYDPRSVYPDPNARHRHELEYVHFHHVYSQHQLRRLRNDSSFMPQGIAKLLEKVKDGNWAGNLRKWEIAPFPSNLAAAAMRRYIVWKRIGFLDAEALEALGEEVPDTEEYKALKSFKRLDADQRRVMVESLWEIWFCDKIVIKVAKRLFQPDTIPVYFVPFRRDPSSIFGIGPAEAALEVVEMLINIARSIDDALDDTSGFQAMIDAGRVENKDLHVQGRKTWIWRDKTGTARGGGASTGKPVEMFTVPSNLPHLLECFKVFEAMLPVVTGVPEMVTGKDLGSGVRTDTMLNDMWESLEEFLRDVIGNVDRYFWKPHLHDIYNWMLEYYENKEELEIDAEIQVQGLRGALKREIVGRKIKEFYSEMHQFGLPDWFDEIELARAIMEGIGIEQEKAILSVDQYVEKQAMLAKKKELESRAQQAPQDEAKEKERAHSSARDVMLQIFNESMRQGKDSGLTPPIIIPAVEKLFKLTGEVDEKVIAAISIYTKMLQKAYAEAAVATPEELKVIGQPVKADNPLELAPGARNPQEAQQAAQQGQRPKTPPNPVPAMPTTQQLPPGGAQ